MKKADLSVRLFVRCLGKLVYVVSGCMKRDKLSVPAQKAVVCTTNVEIAARSSPQRIAMPPKLTPKEQAAIVRMAYKKADAWFESCMKKSTSIEYQMLYISAFNNRISHRLDEFFAVRTILDEAMKLPPEEKEE